MELSLTEQVAYHEEMTRARVPRQTGGLGIVAPTILKFGSAEQRRRYLPLIAEHRASDWPTTRPCRHRRVTEP